MRSARWMVLAALVVPLAALHASPQDGTDTKEKAKPKAADIFDPHQLWTAHIKLSADAWEKIQPGSARGRVAAERGFMKLLGGLADRPATQPATRPVKGNVDRLQPNAFGAEYTYVRGTLEFGGETFNDVGIRFKGNSSYATARNSLKKPLKLDFGRFVEGQEFHGLDQINFHNNACDPSQVREALSYWAFRQAGIPAPRTSFVLLYLTVDGKYDHECLGFYTLVEEIDKRFLKAHFGSKDGLLCKPETAGLPYFGDRWTDSYRDFRPKTETRPDLTKPLIDFLRTANNEDGDDFRKHIEETLEVDEFLRYLAVNVMLSNLDSLLAIGHNFYLYVDPTTKKVSWLPWDMNLTTGAYQRLGGWEELIDMSIDRPYAQQVRLVEKLLQVDDFREAYHQHLKKMTSSFFTPDKVKAEVQAMEAAVREADRIANGAIKGGNPPSVPWTPAWKKPPSPSSFVDGRVTSIKEQLEGKTKGYVPRYRAGGLQGGGRMRVTVVPAYAIDAFKSVDTNKDEIVTLDELTAAVGALFDSANTRGKDMLDETAVQDALEELLPKPDDPDPAGARRARRPNLAYQFAKAILYEADRDLDGQLTKSELLLTAKRLLNEADRDDNGKLSDYEFGEAVARLAEGRAR